MGVEGNVHRIVVPTPLPLGATNVYLIKSKPITIIDTGPDTETTRTDLKMNLAQIDLEMEDIERVVLTHGHVDHCGLASHLAEVCGPEILIHELDREFVQDFGEAIGKKFEKFEGMLQSTGVPPQTLQMLRDFLDFLNSLTSPCDVTRSLKDGDKIEFEDDELEVIHTPGHSSGSCSFKTGDLLFTGDALSAEVFPSTVFGGADGKSMGLHDCLRSMDKIVKLKPKVVYPGHGESIENIKEKVLSMEYDYERRRETIIEFLEKESLTAFELMNRLYGTMSIEQVLMGLGETVGYLEILVEEGMAKTEEKDDLVYYRI